MEIYRIEIESKNYNLRCACTVIAESLEQAKKLAGDAFHENVQGFMASCVKRGVWTEIIDKKLLLDGAKFSSTYTVGAQVLTFGWDRKDK